MIAESLNDQKLDEMWAAEDSSVRHASSWPAWRGEGSDAAACYFEIPPGCRLGAHVHDAEEQVVVLGGRGTATIAGREASVEAPGLVVMPQGVAHDLRNEGAETLRAIGYFPKGSVTTTFELVMEPNGSKTAGTPDETS